MNGLGPSPSLRLLGRQARVIQPPLVEEFDGALWKSRPCKHGHRIDDQAQVSFIGKYRFFGALLFGDISNKSSEYLSLVSGHSSKRDFNRKLLTVSSLRSELSS